MKRSSLLHALTAACLTTACMTTHEASLGARRSTAEGDGGEPVIVPEQPEPADAAEAVEESVDASAQTLDATAPAVRDASMGARDAAADASPSMDARVTHEEEEHEQGEHH